jgi:2-dehydro-3-deoxygalactonokinase
MSQNGRGLHRLICIDTGTTNTRVWLLEGERVVAVERVGVGVRDTARDGSPARLHQALTQAIATVRRAGEGEPQAVLAAGMITSPLGLREVPHLVAPVGLPELALRIEKCMMPEICDLPIWLVPGVRSGPPELRREEIASADVCRGEETLALGLVATGRLGTPATLLNLGSHWKIVRIDQAGRISSSLTSLTGEMIHTIQTQTILAGSLPAGRPEHLFDDWVQAGMAEQRRAGLARALFCVRLLEQRVESTPEERLSYLIGAFIAADLDPLQRQGLIVPGSEVVITGTGPVAGAVAAALAGGSVVVRQLGEAEVEAGLLAGLRALAACSLSRQPFTQG